MKPDDVPLLLRIKQARGHRAEVALRLAQAAQARAEKAHQRVASEAADFARDRPLQETAIYRGLIAGPIPGYRLHQAVAQLSGIVAHAETVEQRLAQAVRHQNLCTETSAEARRTHAVARREVLAVATMHQRLDAARQLADEDRHDSELEELTRHGHDAWPARS